MMAETITEQEAQRELADLQERQERALARIRAALAKDPGGVDPAERVRRSTEKVKFTEAAAATLADFEEWL